mmetsp:Transcript_12296/g.8944  ORF Transcript_12296/g.8944 Transcript_12296/m.8944 type:complete len:130 (+) Transcript_12296:673-1062(+)
MDFEHLSIWSQFYYLTLAVFHACRKNIVLPVCFLGVSIIRLYYVIFNTFIMLWVASFIYSGVLDGEEQAKKIISTINVIAMVQILIFFKVFGWLTDMLPAYITIPIAFGSRVLIVIVFLLLDRPDTWYA